MVLPGDAIVFDKRFKVLSVVGRGRETVVYHACVEEGGEQVALKVLAGRKHRDVILSRLRHEANILLISEHEHIIKLHGLHAMGEHIYLALEYAPYGDLFRYSKRQYDGPLDPKQGELFFLQCLKALAHLEQIGVIHRDIKPDNILLMREDSCKLADFGVAAYSKLATDSKELQLAVGTINYLSPEVLEGAICDHNSDRYALGLTFYHLLGGYNSFDDIPLVEQLELRRSLKIPHLKDLSPELSDNTAHVIMRMLAYNPRDRYSSARDIIKALRDGIKPRIQADYEVQANYGVQAELPAFATSAMGTPIKAPQIEATRVIPPAVVAPHALLTTTVSRPTHLPAVVLPKPPDLEQTSILQVDKFDSMANSMKKRDKSQSKGSEGIPSEVLSRFRMVGADEQEAQGPQQTDRNGDPFYMPSDHKSRHISDPMKPKKSGLGKLLRTIALAGLLSGGILVGTVLVYSGQYYSNLFNQLSFGFFGESSEKGKGKRASKQEAPGAEGVEFTDGFGMVPSEVEGSSETQEAEPVEEYQDDETALSGDSKSIEEGAAALDIPAHLQDKFPMQRGFHVGSLEGLFPQGTTHLSMIVLPDIKGTIVLVGIDGWTPQRVKSVRKPGEVIRVASNGIVLQLSFMPTEDGAEGTVEDMSSGRQGTWSVRKNLSAS